MDDTLTITFRKPVELGGLVYTEMVLREPTVDEYDRATAKAASQLQVSTHLMFYVSGVPLAVIAKLGIRDFMRGADYLAGFLSGGPETGAAESPTSPGGIAGALAMPSA